MSNADKVKTVRIAASAAYHGAKGVEKASSVSAEDTGTTKVMKLANGLKHICLGIEKGLRLRK